MSNDFFSKPILNTPYARPSRHWELDEQGQPTHQIIEHRRPAEFITPIPKPKKRTSSEKQGSIVFDERKGLSTQEQPYDITAIINGYATKLRHGGNCRTRKIGRLDEYNELIDASKESSAKYGANQTFAQIVLDILKTSGVQQAHKDDKIVFTALTPWPGDLVCAEGRYLERGKEKRAAIFIGPEFGTVTRPDLVEAAREAGDAGFDVRPYSSEGYQSPWG